MTGCVAIILGGFRWGILQMDQKIRSIVLQNIHHHISVLIPHPLSMNIGYEEFHCNHVYAGVLTVIQLMVVITFQLEVMDSEHLPAKRICKQILDVICDHNLAPLIGKHHNTGNNIQEFVNKRKCIEYDHERSESSVMNDWVRDVRCFATSSLRGHSE